MESIYLGEFVRNFTVHAPHTYRLFCLRSLIPEQEERSFGDLRSITPSRQCGKVIDNAVLRYNLQQQSDYIVFEGTKSRILRNEGKNLTININ